MKKKVRLVMQRRLRRAGALLSALVLCVALCMPCFATFNDDFNLPSQDEFNKHPSQWYLVKTGGYYYLFPLSFTVSSSGASVGFSCATSPFSATYYTSSSNSYTFYYIDSFVPYYLQNRYPIPFGFGYAQIAFVPSSSSLSIITSNSGGVRYFVGDTSDLLVGSQGIDNSSSKSGYLFGSIYRLPAYWKKTIGNSTSWGNFSAPSTYVTSSSYLSDSSFHALTEFYSLSLFAGDFEYTVPYSSSKIIYTNHLTYNASLTRSAYGSFLTSDSLAHIVYFRFPATVFDRLYGSDYKTGSWFPSDENLQNALVNDFGVDSNTLTNSKSSIESWSNTSSVDTNVASDSLGVLNGLFQNMGQFLGIVSLLCFGAVVLRMLIRKAVA